MECKDFKKLLAQFLDNQLDAKQQELIRKHLASCSACSANLESLRKMVKILNEMKEVDPPENFSEKVNHRLDTITIWQKIYHFFKGFWALRAPVQVATVIATLLLVVSVGNYIKSMHPVKELAPAQEQRTDIVKRRLAKAKSRTLRPRESTEVMVLSKDQAPAPAIMTQVESLEEEPKPSHKLKKVVIASGEENLIAENREQDWIIKTENPNKVKKHVQALLDEFKASDVVIKKGPVFSFNIRYGQLSVFLSRLRQLGNVDMLTPLPVPRIEAYISSQGRINTLVLEEPIFIKLTLLR